MRGVGALLGAVLVGLLAVPVVALVLSVSPKDIIDGAAHPMFAPAIWLSLRTTTLALVLTVVLGTPLAWWIATSRARAARVVSVVVELPIVIPPAVVGVALLMTFGRQGIFGALELPFSTSAVVLAQLTVASPFFVQAAASAFREVDDGALLVARTLGASRAAAFFRVAIPSALPGLVAGASLSFARALGEFGATLIFAGNLSGRTQTAPLAIFSALEDDVRLAVVFSVILVALGALSLVALRALGKRP